MIDASRVVVIDKERTAEPIAGRVAMFLDLAAAVDPSNAEGLLAKGGR